MGSTVVSDELRAAVKLSRRPQYQLAARMGFDPTTFSRIMNQIQSVPAGEPRILRLATLLGVPVERAFDEDGVAP